MCAVLEPRNNVQPHQTGPTPHCCRTDQRGAKNRPPSHPCLPTSNATPAAGPVWPCSDGPVVDFQLAHSSGAHAGTAVRRRTCRPAPSKHLSSAAPAISASERPWRLRSPCRFLALERSEPRIKIIEQRRLLKSLRVPKRSRHLRNSKKASAAGPSSQSMS